MRSRYIVTVPRGPPARNTRVSRRAGASGRALFYRYPEGLEHRVEVGVGGVLRERRHQVQQPLFGLVRRQDLEQMRPGRRERGAVQVTGQVAAQLEGVPVLPRRGPAGPALRGPGRLRLVLGRGLGLEPLLGAGRPVRLQLAADLPLERVILARPVRTAGLFGHWRASLRLIPWRPGRARPEPCGRLTVGLCAPFQAGINRQPSRREARQVDLGFLRPLFDDIGDYVSVYLDTDRSHEN